MSVDINNSSKFHDDESFFCVVLSEVLTTNRRTERKSACYIKVNSIYITFYHSLCLFRLWVFLWIFAWFLKNIRICAWCNWTFNNIINIKIILIDVQKWWYEFIMTMTGYTTLARSALQKCVYRFEMLIDIILLQMVDIFNYKRDCLC